MEQANGVVAIMTDYNYRNIVEEKGIMVVVVMALYDNNRTAVAAEDFVGKNLFNNNDDVNK